MDQKHFEAEDEAVNLLNEVTGDPIDAIRLALAIRKLDEFEELKRLMNATDEFTRRHEGFIRNAIENIQVLNEEIERERLMGKHTSELQSRPHLVCRLLLEKKKQTTNRIQ